MTEPKIRFRRDDGSSFPDWEEIKLGELTYPTGVKNKNNVDLESYSISNEKGFIPQSEQFEGAGYLNDADRTLYYIVSTGSFAYNPARINVGSIGYQNVGKDVLVSSLYEIFNTRDNLNDAYLMNWFKTGYFHKNVMKYSEGGVRQYFYYDKLCMVDFALPSLPEQQKIADFLSNVDEVIAASEEEVANLEQQKKAVMQKIFSQEVRFKKEDGSDFPDWEEKKIGDILTLCHGKDYKHLMAGNIPVMGTGGIIAYVDKALCDWECVCIGRKGTIDKPIYMNVPFWSVDTLFYSKPKPDNLPKFQYFLFQNINWLFYNEASGVPSLSASTIEKIKVIIPSLPEQQKIADFLTSYDEAITAAKQELEKWKELKKGLLQQMFV